MVFMSNVEKLIFWRKVSKYSTLICGSGIVLDILFKKYAIAYRFEVLIFGVAVISIFVFSQLMQLILKNKINSN